MICINEVYGFLRSNEIVQSQEEFSSRFLRKSPRYYSMVKASSHQISMEALNTLAACLRQIAIETKASQGQTHICKMAQTYSQQLADHIFEKALIRKPNTHRKEVQNNI